MQLHKFAKQNITVFGGKGKGKSSLFSTMIYLDRKNKPLSSIPFQYSEVVEPKEYFNSISPNTYKEMIDDKITIVNKNKEWEGRTYFDDDSGIKYPSHEDKKLTDKYASMALFIPIQRHLYNSNTVLNVQDIDRVWIKIREMQVDGYIKALGINGWSWLWHQIPFIRNYVRIKFRYYENHNSAEQGMLPFSKLGLVNEGISPLYLTSGAATKEVYEAQNGVIKDYAVWVLKKNIQYDTRYYHKKVFGFGANESQ